MRVIMPMAGRGSRFANEGITIPKPLIDVRPGEPIFRWALKSIERIDYSQLIVIALKAHDDSYHLRQRFAAEFGAKVEVLLIDDVTEGQLCTVLVARDLINDAEDVLVISSDTYVISEIGSDIAQRPPDCAGIISAADLPGDRWSFARTDDTGRVVEVAEKVRISDHASTGLYYFSRGDQLVAVGEEMIRNGEKTRGEYYVIPVYKKYVERGWRVEVSQAAEMWDMGTPEALSLFQAHLRADLDDE